MGHDAYPYLANIVRVHEEKEQQDKEREREVELPLANVAVAEGLVLEKFLADTGANRSIHPNSRSAAGYSRLKLNIGTANGASSMTSEGVGEMMLYNPNGDQMPGFDRVIFAKEASEKLCSVGDLCDGGLICVFDSNCLKTYKKDEMKVIGNPFTEDTRDPKSRLYPLRLYRKPGEKLTFSFSFSFSLSQVHAGAFSPPSTRMYRRGYTLQTTVYRRRYTLWCKVSRGSLQA